MNQAGADVAYLSGGWFSPEAWGTWSDAENAEITVPISNKVRTILIEADALVTNAHPKQDIAIRINDVLVLTTTLTKSSENLIEITIPTTLQSKISELGLLRLQFQFANAVRPKDIGVNEDGRKLAIGLLAIVFY